MITPATRGLQLERQVADLYDFSLDIARYHSDIEFAQANGRIHYVLDENIFELFVKPYENYSYVVRDQAARRVGRTGRDVTAMQSALLTGEALLSGALPGQHRGTYYMTQWHRWEFLERVSHLLGEISRASSENLRGAMESALRAKHELVSDDDSGVPDDTGGDPFLPEDIEFLRTKLEASEQEVARFARVRRAAALLARDDTAEPMQQLQRALKLDAAGRLQNVRQIASPSAAEDHEQLRHAALEWEERIQRESEARAARLQTPYTRKIASTRSDAQSLALIDWISRRIDPKKERVLFVTGDATLFDAYRRVYEEDAEKRKSGADPFFIRRPLQYSTMFSTDDEADRTSRKGLFYSLQQMVELPLTPIRVASVTSAEAPQDILFRRQSLTLARVEKGAPRTSYFHDAWHRYGDQYNAEQIAGVEAQIDINERISNGMAGHLLERRIMEDQRRVFLQARDHNAEERNRLFSRIADRAVESFIKSAVDMWRPQAEAFFRQAAREDQHRDRRRVPLAVQVAVPDDRSGSPLTKLLDSILDDPLEEGSKPLDASFTITSSFEIFIGAGAMALHANQWRLGDHFCEVAINAYRYFAKYENISERDASEAHYLCALAKRFRLGEIKPGENVSPFASATKLYEGALELLRSSETLSNSVGKGFQSYRSYSERAALGLFYSTLCAESADALDGLAEAAEIQAASIRAFNDAASCLGEALRIERRSGFDPRPRLYGDAIDKIRLQVLVNICAWYAMAPIINPGVSTSEHGELARECARSLSVLEPVLKRADSPLFWAEFYAFKISEGIETETSKARLRKLRARNQSGSVELDRTVFRHIQTLWVQ